MPTSSGKRCQDCEDYKPQKHDAFFNLGILFFFFFSYHAGRRVESLEQTGVYVDGVGEGFLSCINIF